MPVIDIVGGNMAKDDTIAGLEFFDLHLNLVKMRPPVGSTVDSHEFHSPVSPLLKDDILSTRLMRAVAYHQARVPSTYDHRLDVLGHDEYRRRSIRSYGYVE